MTFSHGGIWGEAMYVASYDTIYRVTSSWDLTVFATGFDGLAGMDFAPDSGALCVAQSGNGGEVIQIVPEPAALVMLMLACPALFRRRRLNLSTGN